MFLPLSGIVSRKVYAVFWFYMLCILMWRDECHLFKESARDGLLLLAVCKVILTW